MSQRSVPPLGRPDAGTTPNAAAAAAAPRQRPPHPPSPPERKPDQLVARPGERRAGITLAGAERACPPAATLASDPGSAGRVGSGLGFGFGGGARRRPEPARFPAAFRPPGSTPDSDCLVKIRPAGPPVSAGRGDDSDGLAPW